MKNGNKFQINKQKEKQQVKLEVKRDFVSEKYKTVVHMMEGDCEYSRHARNKPKYLCWLTVMVLLTTGTMEPMMKSIKYKQARNEEERDAWKAI